ncbi:MAG: KilA-N domain-containing protein [Calditrichaeota bacterium]|nr:KilA-N domain-containing protein [Calditrichota bacterium]
MTKKTRSIQVINVNISIITANENDYICITDMAKAKEGDARAADIIKNWIRSRTTLEFLGTWEQMNNPNFKVVEFDHFKMQAGLPSFVLSPGQWVAKTNAIGMFVKSGRYGGTYAHKDIAFEFGSAISPVFKLYLIKEFQRLKDEENSRLKLEWDLQRTISKINYQIHTDAIKENLIPPELTKQQINFIYASEADILNMALFGKTAKEWREENPDASGNIRDTAALEQLVVLSNLESINAVLIRQKLSQSDRLRQLNQIAITQMKSLTGNTRVKKLTAKDDNG